jgi:hypothetical protein
MNAVMYRKSDSAGRLPLLMICVGLLAAHGPLSAQTVLFGTNGAGTNGGLLNGGDPVLMADRSLEREMVINTPLVDHDGPYVLVHIAESRVFVLEGREVIWSAPAGTGNGFELEGQGQEWTFTTPVGMFQVLRKEKDPIWIVPDWWYVQRGWTIPPREDPSRYMENTLGTSALFLGDGIAIHGTDKSRVSHAHRSGCPPGFARLHPTHERGGPPALSLRRRWNSGRHFLSPGRSMRGSSPPDGARGRGWEKQDE